MIPFKKSKTFIVWMCLLPPSASLFAAATLSMALQQDFAAGKITRAQLIGYQLLAAEQPEKLPSEYRQLPISFSQSLTVLAAEARALLENLSVEERRWLQSLLQRPSSQRLPLSIISPNGHFKIHYSISGMDSCSHEYAWEVANAYDYVYHFEVEIMGFDPPPADLEIDGPEYDIYIIHFAPYYGETIFENPVPHSGGMAYTSYSRIDRQFTDARYYTKGLDAMRVTVAHEFFHMIQGGYRFFPTTQLNSVFLFEASSVWMEEMAYPQVNDYIQYVNSFMRAPNRAFHLSDNASYGIGLYFQMISKQYGNQIVNRIWEAFRKSEPLEAIDAGLKTFRESFQRSLGCFTIWNCFTADRADTLLWYHEGHLYPRLTPKATHHLEGQLTISGDCSELVSHYHQITVEQSDHYLIRPQLQSPADWIYTVVVFEPDGHSQTYQIAGDAPLSLPQLAKGSELWLNPTNITIPQANYANHPLNYLFTIEADGAVPELGAAIVAIAPAPFKPEKDGVMEIQFRFDQEQTAAELYIFAENGAFVYHAELGRISRGLNRVSWHGRNHRGQSVASGIYVCLIKGNETLKPKKFALIR